MPATEPLEDIGLEIEDEVFRFWETIKIKLSLDTFSTVEFTAPFEATRREFRDKFRPFQFQPVIVKYGDNRLFTGRIIGINPSVTKNRKAVSVTAYALPAVLHDCTTPISQPGTSDPFPREYKNLQLQAIASILCAPFGVQVDFRGEDGPKFPKVKIDPTKKIFEFLADLAQHRSYVFTDNTFGALLCWKSVTPGTPVARLKDHENPVIGVEASFSPQEFYSEITGFAPARGGRIGGKETVRNPWLPDVLRPMNLRLDKIDKGDAKQTTEKTMDRMFAQMVSYKVDLIT